VRNLFFVMSPLQVICAQEAREAFCAGEENHLVIIDRTPPGTPDYDQKRIELDDKWHKVTSHSEAKSKGLARTVNRLWNSARIRWHHGGAKGKVILGDPKISWFAWLGRRYGTEVVWLDEGSQSITVLKEFFAKGLLTKPNATTPKFFTLFATDDMVAASGGSVVHNTLSQLRRIAAPTQQVDRTQALFLGQWISEYGLLTQDEELKAIAFAQDSLPDQQMTYACHRHDSAGKLAKIEPLMTVTRFEEAIERHLLQQAKVPGVIVSCCSGALLTLRRLYPELTYVAVRPDYDLADAAAQERLRNLYAAFETLGIEVITPPQTEAAEAAN